MISVLNLHVHANDRDTHIGETERTHIEFFPQLQNIAKFFMAG